MNKTKRDKIRRSLMIYLDCINTSTNLEIGKIIDITYEGMLLISEKPLTINTSGNFKIILPLMEQFKDLKIEAKSVCRWNSKEELRELYYIGMEFLEKSDNFDSIVDLLVNKIGFSDGQKRISTHIGESKYK